VPISAIADTIDVVKRFPEAVMEDSKHLFWDIDPSTLDPQLHEDFVLGRVLSLGNVRAVKSVVEEVGLDAIRNFVLRSPHRLDRQSRRFFEVIFSVQDSTCTTKPSRPVNAPLFQP
jgi:hypothetical protein